MDQQTANYERVAAAIAFLQTHAQRQPSLDEVAAAVHLSPFHFHRLFAHWAGTTPKKFLQWLSLQNAKKLLQTPQTNLFETAMHTGLSGTGRLHDLFLQLQGMTPGEYRDGGAALRIAYAFADSPFGRLLVAATPRGICYLQFCDRDEEALQRLKMAFPAAELIQTDSPLHAQALAFFQRGPAPLPQLKLHLRASPFQLQVWAALLQVPAGQPTTYGHLARRMGQPGASRAVGTAIGSNPVAYLIPCHRVIQSSGALGGYAWGPVRKAAMLGWEAVESETMAENQ